MSDAVDLRICYGRLTSIDQMSSCQIGAFSLTQNVVLLQAKLDFWRIFKFQMRFF